MPAFIIVGLTIKDAEKLSQYSSCVPSTLIKYQGEFIAKGAVAERLEGTFEFDTQAVISFPTKEDARNWYYCAEYQALIPLRNEAMDAQFQLIS